MKIFHRLAIWSVLLLFAAFFLLPLYVMVATSLKDMAEVRGGNLLSLPLEGDSRCPKCAVDLHSCVQCESFDTSARWECSASDRLQARVLLWAGGDDDLAKLPMRHTAFGAIGVKPELALAAEPRFQRTWPIVDAGVDDFGIAAAGLAADDAFLFQDEHFSALCSERSPASKANHAGADHHAIDMFAHPKYLPTFATQDCAPPRSVWPNR